MRRRILPSLTLAPTALPPATYHHSTVGTNPTPPPPPVPDTYHLPAGDEFPRAVPSFYFPAVNALPPAVSAPDLDLRDEVARPPDEPDLTMVEIFQPSRPASGTLRPQRDQMFRRVGVDLPSLYSPAVNAPPLAVSEIGSVPDLYLMDEGARPPDEPVLTMVELVQPSHPASGTPRPQRDQRFRTIGVDLPSLYSPAVNAPPLAISETGDVPDVDLMDEGAPPPDEPVLTIVETSQPSHPASGTPRPRRDRRFPRVGVGLPSLYSPAVNAPALVVDLKDEGTRPPDEPVLTMVELFQPPTPASGSPGPRRGRRFQRARVE
jgi:hypothetical protein